MSKNYQIISRKYRPHTFANIVGQDPIVATLKNALHSKRLAHAYLFCGSRGTGKTTLARVFAKALNCMHLTQEGEPCNACPSCQAINAGSSLDVLEIDGASNRGIDDIRNLNETVGYAPALGTFKIYIIDEVHMLTKEAFNALLKTLEEPPSHVKFFFATTEPHKVLPTIVSRCQRFDLSRIAPHLMIQKLKRIAQDLEVSCEEDVFYPLTYLSEGSLRDAESLLDQLICSVEAPITVEKLHAVLGLSPKRVFFALDRAFNQQTLSYALELAQEVFASGKDPVYFLDMLIDHYRTLLHIKLGQPSTVFHPAEKESYASSSSFYTQEQCLYILDYLIHWQQQLGKIPFKRIFLEMLLLHILRSKYRLSHAALVKRLSDLEHKHALPAASSAEPKAEKAVPEHKQEEEKEAPAIPAASAEPTVERAIHKQQKEEACQNNLKNREFGEETSQNPLLEQAPIVRAQGASEEENFEKEPTLPKTDATGYFGIPVIPAASAKPAHAYETLLQFAAIELEGNINYKK
ncbi:MAG TPA: DNA polymerase III subunit gamma/tau [Rhabdochlamydiaceae bacterium]|jgi:DNA polymerase-3 subunit gamma/tau